MPNYPIKITVSTPCGNNYTEIKEKPFLRVLLVQKPHGNIFYTTLCKIKFMRSILYLIAVICIIGWLLGFFVWSAGHLIHVLIVIAVIALLIAIIRRA